MSEQPDETYTTEYRVDVDQAQQGLLGLTQTTQQYAQQASGLVGTVVKLGAAVGGLSRHFEIAKPNAATSEAARYQQALSGLDATVKVAVKNNRALDLSFSSIQKTTKQLAREMPIGFGQAVQQVTALQESGVKANREVKTLAKAFTELGGANGGNAIGLGKDMLDLSRTFGSTTGQVVKYNDSLTAVTQTLGGTASGTLSFAKAIAPVAATVGIGQAKVIGLSNAFSRLGEDGYGAATAVQKVMVDLSKSIRQGTPDVSNYARLLGTSADHLEKMFKQDPSSVLVKFVDSIAKAGPNALSSLETLGFDSIRTTRSVQAVARSGGLQKSIDTAVAGYGNGSTRVGAEAAYGGLNDQLTKLQETGRQTVEAAGRPLLGILTSYAKIANMAAGATNAVANSGPVQAAQVPLQTAGVVAGGALHLAAQGATIAFARIAARGIGKAYQTGRGAWNAGRMAGAGGYAAETAEMGMMQRGLAGAGEQYGAAHGGPMMGPVLPMSQRLAGVPAGAMGGLRATGRGLSAGMTAAIRSAQYDVVQARTGLRPITVARSEMRAEMAAAKSMTTLAERTAAQTAAIEKFIAASVEADAGLKRLAGTALTTGVATSRYAASQGMVLARGAGGVAGRGLRGAAGMIGFRSAGGLAGGVLAADAYMLYKGHQISQEGLRASTGGTNDPYGLYNDFATRVGLANKSVPGRVNADGTIDSVSHAKNFDAAYNVDHKEYRAFKDFTGNVGFKLSKTERGKNTGFWDATGRIMQGQGKNPGQASADYLTTRAAMMLGPNVTPDQISTVLRDLGKQGVSEGRVDKVAAGLQKIYGADGVGQVGYGHGFSAAAEAEKASGSSLTTSKGSGKRINETFAYARQRAMFLTEGRGEDAQAGALLNEQIKAFSAYQKTAKNNKGVQLLSNQVLEALADATGLDKKDLRKALGAKTDFVGHTTFSNNDLGAGIAKLMKDGGSGENTKGTLEYLKGLQAKGYAIGDSSSLTGLSTNSEIFKQNRKDQGILSGAYQQVTGKKLGSGLSTAFFGSSINSGDASNGAVEGRTASLLKDAVATPLVKAIKALGDKPSEETKYGLGKAAAGQAFADARGNVGVALQQLATTKGSLTDQNQRDSMDKAAEYLQNVLAPRRQASNSFVGNLREGMINAKVAIAQNQGDTDDQVKARQEAESSLGQMQAQGISTMTQYNKQVIDTYRQIHYAQMDFEKQSARANIDYGKQRLYAEQDYGKQIYRAHRDFNRQMAYSDEDYVKQRGRAMEDFRRQTEYAKKDSAKSAFGGVYERVQVKDIWDAGGLTSNIANQVQVMRKQSANIKKLKKMGLSQRTIDALDLYNPENAMQVDRLVMDFQNDRSEIGQMNKAVDDKIKAGGQLVAGGEDFRRQEKEFKLSMSRMSADMATQRKRAKIGFSTQMNDAAHDFSTGMSRMADSFHTSQTRMQEDLNTTRNRALTTLKQAKQDLVNTAEDTADLAGRMIAKGPEHWRTPMKNVITSLGEMLGVEISKGLSFTITTKPNGGKLVTTVTSPNVDQKRPGGVDANSGGGGGGGTPGVGLPGPIAARMAVDDPYSGACLHDVADVLGAPHKYSTAYKAWLGARGHRHKMGLLMPIGAPIFWGPDRGGGLGHVAVNAGGGMMWSEDKDNAWEKKPIWSGALGWSDNLNGAQVASSFGQKGFASGSWNLPADQHADVHRGEMIIPASIAEVVRKAVRGSGQWINPHDVRRTMSAAAGQSITIHSTHSYDQSMKIMGPVHVMADDPNAMRRALERKQAQHALLNPAGSASR